MVDNLVATVSLFSPIATLGIGDVITMLLSKREYEEDKIFTNVVALIVIGNILVSLVYPFLFLSDIFNGYVVYFIMLVVFSSVYGVLQMYAKGTDKIASCAISGVVYTVTLSASNILLLLCFHQGISGYFLSTILAYLVPAVYLFAVTRDKCFKITLFDKELIIKILGLSIPLIPTTILWVLMNLADRYAILWFVGISGNGIYAIAHKIPTIIYMIYGIFQPAWQLTTFELDSKEERSSTYTKVFELLTCIMFCLAAVLIILNRIYILCFCDVGYNLAWKVTPILMYSSVLNCISGFLDSNYLIMRDTKAILKVTFWGAMLNVILNVILVPICGLYGAAIATGVGYLYMVGKKYFDTSKFTPIRMEVSCFFLANFILIIMCISVFIKIMLLFYLFNLILAAYMLFIYRNQYRKVVGLVINKILRKKRREMQE